MILNDKMWFGTAEKMQYVPVPLASSEFTNVGWEDSDTLLNGGGWSRFSRTTHKEFALNWGMSLREDTQVIKDYRDGLYGDGPIYFVDPMAEWLNLFPAWFAAPMMGCADAPSLFRGQVPAKVDTPSNDMGYPLYSARYNVTGWNEVDSGRQHYIPIPPHAALNLGAHGSRTGTAVVQVRARTVWGSYELINLPLLSANSPTRTNVVLFGSEYTSVRIYITRTTPVASTITLSGLVANVSTTLDPTTLNRKPYIRDGEPFINPGDTSLYPFLLGDRVFIDTPVAADRDIALVDGNLATRDSDIMLLDVSAPPIPTINYDTPGRFIGGRGHSGCSFVGAVIESPVGGRPEMSTIAAKLTETGAWG